MSNCTSTFGEADYGCGENGSLTAAFEVTPAGFSHSLTAPDQAVIALNTSATLTINNVKYSTTTDQDVSAWIAISSSTTPIIETNKTFVAREDCATTTNTLNDTAQVNIVAGDAIKAKGKWSGFDGSQVGLDVPNCDWFDIPLNNNYTITPPQNLQVTFPSDPTGNIAASISSWSLNPNISGTPFAGLDENGQPIGNNWNWKIELLDSNSSIIGVTLLTKNTNLSQTLKLGSDIEVKPNTAYRMRVTVSNEYQATATVTSPVIYSKPNAPIIRRVTFEEGLNNNYNAIVDWAKPRNGGVYDEVLQLNAGSYANNVTIAEVSGGVSATGSYTITGLPVATAIDIKITSTSTAGQSEVVRKIFTPAIAPTIGTTWDEKHKCVTITPTSPNVSKFNIGVGYTRGSNALANNAEVVSTQVCDLEHGSGELLYVSATPTITGHTYTEAISNATVPILNPILGLSKTCEESLNVVDIVETKKGNGATERWQTGDRVVVNSKCAGQPGGG